MERVERIFEPAVRVESRSLALMAGAASTIVVQRRGRRERRARRDDFRRPAVAAWASRAARIALKDHTRMVHTRIVPSVSRRPGLSGSGRQGSFGRGWRVKSCVTGVAVIDDPLASGTAAGKQDVGNTDQGQTPVSPTRNDIHDFLSVFICVSNAFTPIVF